MNWSQVGQSGDETTDVEHQFGGRVRAKKGEGRAQADGQLEKTRHPGSWLGVANIRLSCSVGSSRGTVRR